SARRCPAAMSARTPRAAAAAFAASPAPRPLGSTGTPGTPVLAECPNNDDERERRQRRRSRAVDSAVTDAAVSRRPESWQPPLPQWSNAQIAEHYSTCIKLCSENKITTKNAFGLHLIDYMTEILKQKNSELTNFKVAAGTLDASAKIYAVRVDSVHADTYRVLGNLGKDSAPAKDPPAPEAARKAQPRKKQTFRTIEHNLNNINLPEASRGSEVDPMFQRAAASFDECSTAGIFLTGLRSQSFQSRLLFHSGIIPLPSSDTPALPSSDPVPVADLKALLAQCLEKRRICSSLAGFQFSNWDEESHSESVSALLEKFRKSEQVFDPNVELDSDDGEGAAPPEFQLESPGSTAGERIGEFPENLGSFGTPLGEGDITTMSLHLSMNPGEYSYFSPRTLSMWAGPEHWRFRPRHRPDTGSEGESRRRNPRKVFELDFEEDVDFEPHFRKTKASTTLAKSILESQNVRGTTLPADFHYDPKNMAQLFLKPTVRVREPSLKEFQGIIPGDHSSEAGIGDYDYNNPSDTCNFCPALQDPDSDDDPDPAEFQGEAGEFNLTAHPEAPERTGINGVITGIVNGVVNGGDVTTYGELTLIAEPQKINRIAIQYARTAKKMDMRRLKRDMWELLTGAGEEVRNSSELCSGIPGAPIPIPLFHRLPPAMATNLSVPLAFVCLLHLANEKNLKLQSTEDLSDILVQQGD
uniref:Condensin complex subunit 2 n=1 Tax=Corvus moneduloides TaxID=1196302 RepID=A0A8C3DJQ9_CORMO